jgi:hypothetical protein
VIKLHVVTDAPPMGFKRFVKTHEPYSLALDGYVTGGPKLDRSGPHANFNHHEEVDRLATRATCAQTLMAIRQGLFSLFRDDKGPRLNAYVNDCDEDVCTSWFLLKHHHLVQSTMNPMLNRLVAMEDALDSTAGAYPFPVDLPTLSELNWVFEPYREFRSSGALSLRKPLQFANVIELVEHRIMAHITGAGKAVPLDTRYERVGGGTGWAMVKELGANARTGMFAEGVSAYVAVRERQDGRFTYTVGKMSSFVPFDVQLVLDRLNDAEHDKKLSSDPNALPGGDFWGGSDSVGGSPRVGGSSLTPDEVQKVVEAASQESESTRKR